MTPKIKMKDFGFTKLKGFFFISLTLASGFFEGFGMAMLLPVLEFVEKGSDPNLLAKTSRLWEYIVAGFSLLTLKVTFAGLLISVFLLIIFRVVVVYLRQIFSAWLSQDIMHHTRLNLFTNYVHSEYSCFDENSTGSMVNTITTETQRVGSYFISLFAFISNFIVIISLLVVLFILSIYMTLTAILLVFLASIAISFHVRHTKKISLATTMSNKDLSFMLIERLTSMRLIKLSAVTDREAMNVGQASKNVRDNIHQLNIYKARIDLILEPFVVASCMIILYTAMTILNMSLSQIGVFTLILLKILPLAKEMMKSRQTLLSNYGSLMAVKGAFKTSRANVEHTNKQGHNFKDIIEGICFEKVQYTYPGSEIPALINLNLFIPAKRMTALVGPSGAGKSTFVDLLPILRKPEKGRILFDGRPSAEFDLNCLRQSIAFVSQEASILNDTVKANIMFSCNNPCEDDMWIALKKARCENFVRCLPDGINTVLGERGTKLSGGQRQRLSLARAFFKRAPIMVLDEPTSALDSEVESDIQKAMDDMRHNKNTTIIIIAHRMSTIRQADKIIVFQEGRVVQEGTHEELISVGDWYSLVTDLQSQ